MPRGGARRGAGRPRKSDEGKRRLGNPGKRPLTVLPVENGASGRRPSRQKDGAGSTIAPFGGSIPDGDLAGALDAGSWLKESDAPTIRLVQDAWDERLSLSDHIKEHGHVVTVPVFKAGELVATSVEPNPAVKMLRDLEKNLTVWLSQLGLNPSDRGRLGLNEVKTAKTGLSLLREEVARKAGRPAG